MTRLPPPDTVTDTRTDKSDTATRGGFDTDGLVAPNTEIELKLTARREDLARLATSATLAVRAPTRPITRLIETSYFDTDAFTLWRRRVALRVRRDGDRFTQSVKADAVPGEGLARREWETPVSGLAPNLGAITASAARKRLGPVDAAALRPVFTTRVLRATRPVDGGAVELACDIGEIITHTGAIAPIAELELELRDGSPADLYALARRLADEVPLSLDSRSKAHRGFALALGRAAPWSKAGPTLLDPDDSVEAALVRIGRQGLAHLVDNLPCALAGNDVEGVHQVRVALRRLRSALSVFKAMLPDDQRDRHAAMLARLGRALGSARDWDVFLTELVAPVACAFADRTAWADRLATLTELARRHRDQAYQALRAEVTAPTTTPALLAFAHWIEARGWRTEAGEDTAAVVRTADRPVAGFADQLLGRRYRRVRRAGAHLAKLGAVERHELRIALKKLRYAIEFFRALYDQGDDRAVRRFLKLTVRLQDALGHFNDVATASRLLSTLAADPAPGGSVDAAGLVLGWHARGTATLEPQLLADWKAFIDQPPFWDRGGGD